MEKTPTTPRTKKKKDSKSEKEFYKQMKKAKASRFGRSISQASGRVKLNQQFTVNCALRPCYSSHKRYLRSAASRSVCFTVFGGLFSLGPTKIWTAPLGGLLQKKHTASSRSFFFATSVNPPTVCFLSCCSSLRLSFSARSSGDGTGRVSGSATRLCLASRLSKQIAALGHKTPYFFTCYDKSKATQPRPPAASQKKLNCFTRL